jgi:hypothetical protein
MIMLKEEHDKRSGTYAKLTSSNLEGNVLESMPLLSGVLERHIPNIQSFRNASMKSPVIIVPELDRNATPERLLVLGERFCAIDHIVPHVIYLIYAAYTSEFPRKRG